MFTEHKIDCFMVKTGGTCHLCLAPRHFTTPEYNPECPGYNPLSPGQLFSCFFATVAISSAGNPLMDPLCLASFTQRVFKLHAPCNKYQYFISCSG